MSKGCTVQFKKFERSEGGRLMYTAGTGLGLYVAKLMADAHRGSISGESEGKGQGSAFTPLEVKCHSRLSIHPNAESDF